MRLVSALVWISPWLAVACSPGQVNGPMGSSSGGTENGGESGATSASGHAFVGASSGSGSGASGGTGASVSNSGASSGSATAAESGTASGSTESSGSGGSGASANDAASESSGSKASPIDANTAGMVGAGDVDAAPAVQPPTPDCPNGCNSTAPYPPMMSVGTPTPIGDQTQPRKLYIENQCSYAIWTQSNDNGMFPGNAPLKTDPGQAFVLGWSNSFSGRIWPRSGCDGNGNNCTQSGNDTLAEFTLTAGMNSDWYDISLVDGFTIPVGIIQLSAPWTPNPTYVAGGPLGADQECGSPICAVDLNANCPASQQELDGSGHVWGCKNGQSGNGGHNPTSVTSYLKAGCPTSYTYPYDDPQSLFLCTSAAQNNGIGSKDYKIIYCPTQGSTPGFP
jgi:hypothetical protein